MLVTGAARVNVLAPPALALKNPPLTGAATVTAPVDENNCTVLKLVSGALIDTPVNPFAEKNDPLVTADETWTALANEVNDTLPPPMPVLESVLIGALTATRSRPWTLADPPLVVIAPLMVTPPPPTPSRSAISVTFKGSPVDVMLPPDR